MEALAQYGLAGVSIGLLGALVLIFKAFNDLATKTANSNTQAMNAFAMAIKENTTAVMEQTKSIEVSGTQQQKTMEMFAEIIKDFKEEMRRSP